MPPRKSLPLKDFATVKAQTRVLLKRFQSGAIARKSNWIDEAPAEGFFDIERNYFTRPPIPFQPFARKVKIPAGDKVIFHGDFHGDIRSFVSTLKWLNENELLDGFKLKPNVWFAFLGDYTDRGSYGIEVMYTLMRLKMANPDRILLARGNHEDFRMTATYGFLREGQMKYGRGFDPLAIARLYEFLPAVIYVGVGQDYVQCNHGGMEPGFDPTDLLAAKGNDRYQLLGELTQKEFANDNPEWLRKASASARATANGKLRDFQPESPALPQPIGFMWNDFFVFADEPVIGFNESRLAFNHGRASTAFLLKSASSESATLRAVFRAHQHSSRPNPAMNRIIASNGAFRHWQASDSSRQSEATKKSLRTLLEQSPERRIPEGSVWTFNVAPDSVYGSGNGYAFDTIGILKTAESFGDWRLRVVNVPVPIN